MAGEIIINSPDVGQESHWRSGPLELANGRVVDVAVATAAAGERPNEDAYTVYNGPSGLYVATYDGATSLEPLPGLPHGKTGARLASGFLRDMLPEVVAESPGISPHDLIVALNERFRTVVLDLGADFDKKDSLPGSTITIWHIGRAAVAQFAHVGDGVGWTESVNGVSTIITEDKNAPFDLEILYLMRLLAWEHGMSPEEVRNHEDVIKALRDARIEKDNRPDGNGTGIVNGDENVEQYIQSGDIEDLEELRALLATTDGLFSSLLDPGRAEHRNKIYKCLERDGNFLGAIHLTREFENRDQEWWNLRLKEQDDATGAGIIFL